jgi:hypothetical protein
LQPAPKSLKVNLGQFFAHMLLTLPKAGRARQLSWQKTPGRGGGCPVPTGQTTCPITRIDLTWYY